MSKLFPCLVELKQSIETKGCLEGIRAALTDNYYSQLNSCDLVSDLISDQPPIPMLSQNIRYCLGRKMILFILQSITLEGEMIL